MNIQSYSSPRKVAICDVNKVRAEFYNETLVELSQPRATYYKTDDFLDMLKIEKVQTVVVTTVDAFHDVYIVHALHAGGASRSDSSSVRPTVPELKNPVSHAVRVITEKPMTTSVEKCRRINAACQQLGKSISVAFNYRFNPVHELVKRTIQDGEIGKVLSVHFEWCVWSCYTHWRMLTRSRCRRLLDTVHGAEYVIGQLPLRLEAYHRNFEATSRDGTQTRSPVGASWCTRCVHHLGLAALLTSFPVRPPL